MALQIRRGLEAGRAAVTPAPGELLFTTDQSKLYIGDGATVGGTLVTGSGIDNVVDDTTPQLGGNLDVNGKKIVSVTNGNIIIDPDGVGIVSVRSTLAVGHSTSLQNGNLVIIRNTYSSVVGEGLLFTQHHATANAVTWTMNRSRGTSIVPTVVSTGDELGKIRWAGHDGTQPITSAEMTVTVDGTVSSNRIPTKFEFTTNSSVNTAVRAVLSSTGIWKVNSIQNLSGTDLTLTATTVKIAGDVQINSQGDLRFADADSTNWVAFAAPGTVAANVTWTLPAADGTSGQVLSTNGLGTLSWAAGGGAGLTSRTSVSETTASLANGATDSIIVTGAKGYVLYKIQTSVAAWVRIYTSVAARTTDSSRTEGVDPLPDAGVIAEVITTGASTIIMSPGVFGFNNETSPSSNIALAVTNKSGITSVVTVTLTILQIEA